MNRILCSTAALLIASASMAQLSFGGTPYGIKAEKNGMQLPNEVKMPAVNVDALKAEDEANLAAGEKGPYRFGFNHEVAYELNNSGTWNTMPNGDRVWSFSAFSKGAKSINLEFSQYVIPQGAMVFVYNEAREFVGGFTAESNPGFTSMGVAPIPGERITVEYVEPASVAGQGSLRIGRITHAYRDIFNYAKGFGDSGSCNNNVICPEGDNWRDQIRSVARIVVNGNGACTGQLLNNCSEDGTPYFLTANHCLGGSTANWVFQFNWDSPTCTPTTNGPTNQTVAGAQTLTSSGGSDVALLQINSAIPSNFNVFYSGWDNSGNTPSASTAIHHPSGDIKKISFDTDPATQAAFGGAQCWRISTWEDGTTEPGSSGSGLWADNGLLIGQLYGGQANCSNNVNDYYGRFDVSWPLLQSHLGSCGTTLDGYDPNAAQVNFDGMIQSINNVPASTCNDNSIQPSITIKNNGLTTLTSLTIDHDVDGGTSTTINWTGSLATGQTDDISLGTITAGNGVHTLNASASNPNGNPDQNPVNDSKTVNFIIVNPGAIVDLNITLDNYGSETTWELRDANNNLLYTGGPYGDNLDQTVVSDQWCLGLGCYVFTMDDDADDGICCGFGMGHFEIEDAAGAQLVNNDGQFLSSVTENFCITSVGVTEEGALSALSISPIPSTGLIQVTLPAMDEPLEVMVRDAVGRLVLNQRIAAGSTSLSIDLSRFDAGNYTVQFVGRTTGAVRGIVLND